MNFTNYYSSNCSFREIIQSCKIEIATRKSVVRERIADGVKSRVSKQAVTTYVSEIHGDRSRYQSANTTFQKIDPSKSRLALLKLRPESRSAPRLSLSRERRTEEDDDDDDDDDDDVLPCRASKNGFEIQLRGLTYSEVSKRGRLILARM